MDFPNAAILAGLAAAYLACTLAASFAVRAGFPLPPGERRIGCLDGLRGYLALSVLVHHFAIWFGLARLGRPWGGTSVSFFDHLGAGSVALFFMTTGFLFYPRVLAGLRATPWHVVIANRGFRLIPLVAVSVAMITAVIAARTGRGLDAGYPRAALEWVLALSQPPLLGYPDSGRLDSYVLWSLKYEWKFYLVVLPACALAADLLRRWLPSWIVPAGLFAFAMADRAVYPRSLIPLVLPLFALGMLAHECRSREWLAHLLRTRTAAVVALAALVYAMLAFSSPFTFAMPLYAFFFTCVACGNDLGGLLRTRGALALGECSFGIYLFHGIALSLLFVEAGPWSGSVPVPALIAAVALVVVAVSMAGNLLVEQPAIRLGRRLTARLAQRRPRAPAPEGLSLGLVR